MVNETVITSMANEVFEAPLCIYLAAEEGVITFDFSALKTYHGHGALAMLAITYQGLAGALSLLDTDGQPILRSKLSVVSGHAGPGVRDAFEFVTRAVTRGDYVIDESLPWARYSPDNKRSYSFELTYGVQRVRAILRSHVLPPRFFELFGQTEPAQQQEAALLRRQIAKTVLCQQPDELFDFERLV